MGKLRLAPFLLAFALVGCPEDHGSTPAPAASPAPAPALVPLALPAAASASGFMWGVDMNPADNVPPALAGSLGVKWARLTIPWRRVEPVLASTTLRWTFPCGSSRSSAPS